MSKIDFYSAKNIKNIGRGRTHTGWEVWGIDPPVIFIVVQNICCYGEIRMLNRYLWVLGK